MTLGEVEETLILNDAAGILLETKVEEYLDFIGF
jgi:hypothetical protein